MVHRFPVPRVLVSRCLGFAACRYDAQMLSCHFVERLKPYVEMVPVCPEAESGLGIPRAPIRLYEEEGFVMVHQPATNTDVTNVLNSFIDPFIAHIAAVDGAILKSKSPSCGLVDTKIYKNIDMPSMLKKGSGVFGGKVQRSLGTKAVEDEMRLTNFNLREHFLIKLFSMARFRRISESLDMAELISFQASNKLLFMAYNQSHFRKADKIVANHEKLPTDDVFRLYRKELTTILQKPFATGAIINSLHHALGGVSDEMGSGERKYLVDLIEEYRDERVALQAITRLIHAHAIRFDNSYLIEQTFLEPYPRGLVDLSDTGRGKELI